MAPRPTSQTVTKATRSEWCLYCGAHVPFETLKAPGMPECFRPLSAAAWVGFVTPEKLRRARGGLAPRVTVFAMCSEKCVRMVLGRGRVTEPEHLPQSEME